MNIDIIERDYYKHLTHNQVCKMVGTKEDWNDEPLREKVWEAVYDTNCKIKSAGKKSILSGLSACEMKKLIPSEIYLLKNGFWFELDFDIIGLIHQSWPHRTYKRGDDEAFYYIHYEYKNGHSGVKGFSGVRFRYNGKVTHGFPTLDQIKEYV